VLCVYLGLYHPTVGAAVGSFVLGYSIDVVSSRLLGLNAFAMTLVFLAVYFSSRSIWLHHPVVSSLIVLFAALVKGAALVLVWVVFLSTEGFWSGAARYIIMEALLAAALAPLVFSLFRRGESYLSKFDAVA
jgi:rod shape-determining protein MreD